MPKERPCEETIPPSSPAIHRFRRHDGIRRHRGTTDICAQDVPEEGRSEGSAVGAQGETGFLGIRAAALREIFDASSPCPPGGPPAADGDGFRDPEISACDVSLRAQASSRTFTGPIASGPDVLLIGLS